MAIIGERSLRQRRVAREVMRICSRAIINLGFHDVTITDVDASRDLQYCDIFVRSLTDDSKTCVKKLYDATDQIMALCKCQLYLKKLPKFRFFWDMTYDKASRIDYLLNSDNANRVSEDLQ